MTAIVNSKDEVRAATINATQVVAPDAAETTKPVGFVPQTPESYELLGTEPVLPLEERIIQMISRTAGPVVLVGAAAGLAYLFI